LCRSLPPLLSLAAVLTQQGQANQPGLMNQSKSIKDQMINGHD
jgi:hypothetical protein